jgi:hypothetical protein
VSDFHARPLFDVASFARRGPGQRDRLSPAEIDQVRRTVGRAPEVVVKVLAGGQPTVKGARQHLEYVGREGSLELETDGGERLTGGDAAQQIVNDWDLDLEEDRPGSRLNISEPARRLKLVHKLVFSMPPGTPADKVLGAVRDFAREEFALKHRYAFALHTDDDHPHVHVIVKAVSEQGERLNIRKETLRRWRAEFARHLREHGVEGNATERAVRGSPTKAYSDGIYRAAAREASAHVATRIRAAARGHDRESQLAGDAGIRRLHATSGFVYAGYFAIAKLLDEQGERALSASVERFADQMRYPLTEQQRVRERAREVRSREQGAHERERPPNR